MSLTRRKAGLLIGLLLSTVCFAFLARRANWHEVREAIAQVGLWPWALCVGIYLAGFLPRGIRWRLMLSATAPVPLREATKVIVVGYATNNILPFRLGEFVRAYLLSRRTGISKLTCLGSVAAERVFDGLTLLAILASALPFLSLKEMASTKLKWMGVAAALIFIFVTAALVLVLHFEAAVLRLAQRVNLPKAREPIAKLIRSLHFLKSTQLVARVVTLSFLIWAVEGAMFVAMLSTMGIEHAVPRGYFCLVVINLGILIPSAPGYIGIFQAGAVAAFLAMGLGESEGLAFGLLVHLAQFLPITVLGLIMLPGTGISSRELLQTPVRLDSPSAL